MKPGERIAANRDVAAFVRGVTAAARGVVLVAFAPATNAAGATGSHVFCTGWLITETLVVAPYLATTERDEGTYTCHVDGESAIAAAVTLGADGRDGPRPGLLRLHTPLPGRALSLATDAPLVDQQVCLVHYPEGARASHLSIGRLLAVDALMLRYDVSTPLGSSGAPVLNENWAVVGMHMLGARDGTSAGPSLASVLLALRESRAWPEIARHHKLADVGAVRRALEEPARGEVAGEDAALLYAAVRWSFDPAKLSADTAERLRRVVIESSDPMWSLPAAERAAALERAGSLQALRTARGEEPSDDPGQAVIDRILRGPPYSLDEVSDEDLPYWLQASRWFRGVVPSLPTPSQVNATLERRRLRTRLERVGGADFRGRREELGQLRAWYGDAQAGPMVLTGIGGVGKSALVARFVLDLPGDPPHAWIDFDRADIAPDDAKSIIRAIAEQLDARAGARRSGEILAAPRAQALSMLGDALEQDPAPPLLILDGFEVAQHRARHREIWDLLEELMRSAPRLRVLVAGRASVAGLELGGRPARPIPPLRGLAELDARDWLRDAGIEDEGLLEAVLEITHCVPLALQLAARWVSTGADLAEMPADLPEKLVGGFLYQRILDRVMDPALRSLARDALVLRRVTPEAVAAVLGDSLPPQLDAGEVFLRLTQEMALVGDAARGVGLRLDVGDAGSLRLRPELRVAALPLLERENRERVRAIDARAAEWYQRQDTGQPVNAAELVYHRLRLGDVAAATAAWRPECAVLLLDAAEELPADAAPARAWLRERLGGAGDVRGSRGAWETDAYSRVRELLSRGHVGALAAVLAERRDRCPASPLILYDALVRWWAGDLAGARELLRRAPPADGEIGRNRAVLQAKLALAAGDRGEADQRLRHVSAAAEWATDDDPELDVLTVEAARVRLTIDPESELRLSRLLETSSAGRLDRILPPSDVVMPFLAEQLGGAGEFQVTPDMLLVPREPTDLGRFARELDRLRGAGATDGELPLPVAFPLPAMATDEGPWHASQLALTVPELLSWTADPRESRAEAHAVALQLALLGCRRWRETSGGLFLARAIDRVSKADTAEADPRYLATLATLGAFVANERGAFMLVDGLLGPLREVIYDAFQPTLPTISPTERGTELLGRVLAQSQKTSRPGKEPKPRSSRAFLGLLGIGLGLDLMKTSPHSTLYLFLYLVLPDPLDVLVRRVAGLPESVTLPPA